MILNYSNFIVLHEYEKKMDEFFESFEGDNINENIGVILGSPIKFMGIKKAAKQYQQALVQKSLNTIDFEKKKAAGKLDPEKKEVLIAANKAKNSALDDKASAISSRMDQLATTDGLKTVVSIAKNKSKLAAAEVVAKVADGEEAKALNLKIQGLNNKIKDSQQELEDYKKNNSDDSDSDSNLDNVKTTDGKTLGDTKKKTN